MMHKALMLALLIGLASLGAVNISGCSQGDSGRVYYSDDNNTYMQDQGSEYEQQRLQKELESMHEGS